MMVEEQAAQVAFVVAARNNGLHWQPVTQCDVNAKRGQMDHEIQLQPSL